MSQDIEDTHRETLWTGVLAPIASAAKAQTYGAIPGSASDAPRERLGGYRLMERYFRTASGMNTASITATQMSVSSTGCSAGKPDAANGFGLPQS